MLTLIERIRDRLALGAYSNEAAISHGIVTPLLNALGWDSADPDQLVPEFTTGRGRVDFALFGLGKKPAVFIEVKAVGKSAEGDRQLFEYAFHQGVPLCVLTDGREWSFYLPSGHGSYDDRRLYRLQLDDRDPSECVKILDRYLSRDRVRDGRAFIDAQHDHRDAAGQREAEAIIPRAWSQLVAEQEDLLLDLVADKADALSGYKPSTDAVLAFLRKLSEPGASPFQALPSTGAAQSITTEAVSPAGTPMISPAVADRTVEFTIFQQPITSPNAGAALVEILRVLAARNPALVVVLADAVRTRKRNPIARRPEDINPDRPDIARAAEFAPGWLVGLNISNREKMTIIRAACEIFGLAVPRDLELVLPNG